MCQARLHSHPCAPRPSPKPKPFFTLHTSNSCRSGFLHYPFHLNNSPAFRRLGGGSPEFKATRILPENQVRYPFWFTVLSFLNSLSLASASSCKDCCENPSPFKLDKELKTTKPASISAVAWTYMGVTRKYAGTDPQHINTDTLGLLKRAWRCGSAPAGGSDEL